MNNYELKINVDEAKLLKHYLKLNPYCEEWDAPDPEELTGLKQF